MRGAPLFQSQTPSSLVQSNFPNFHILMILLKVNPAYVDELQIVYENFYEISIFAWSSILGIGHYC